MSTDSTDRIFFAFIGANKQFQTFASSADLANSKGPCSFTVKVLRQGDSEETFLVFESSCHLLHALPKDTSELTHLSSQFTLSL